MKPIILIFALATALAWDAQAQGRVYFRTIVQTRLWSADGPIAGPGIWGQLLAGPTQESLAPVGIAGEHNIVGNITRVGDVEVPTVPCNSYGYAQMVAWDGTLWGTVLAGVPLDQLGYTDVVSVPMTCFPSSTVAPPFMQPAIVPVPEPSTLALAGLGIVILTVLAQRRHCRQADS